MLPGKVGPRPGRTDQHKWAHTVPSLKEGPTVYCNGHEPWLG